MGDPYRFARAIAEAAGWESPPTDDVGVFT
jgi:hypothetical protein